MPTHGVIDVNRPAEYSAGRRRVNTAGSVNESMKEFTFGPMRCVASTKTFRKAMILFTLIAVKTLKNCFRYFHLLF